MSNQRLWFSNHCSCFSGPTQFLQSFCDPIHKNKSISGLVTKINNTHRELQKQIPLPNRTITIQNHLKHNNSFPIESYISLKSSFPEQYISFTQGPGRSLTHKILILTNQSIKNKNPLTSKINMQFRIEFSGKPNSEMNTRAKETPILKP